jgi:UDP-N-acetylmuramate--alanine ligase
MIPRVSDRRIVTYGMSPQADIRATNLQIGPTGARFDVVIGDRLTGGTRALHALGLPMLGAHNVQNSLAAIAVAQEMGFDDATVRKALAGFRGVKRRFTRVGETRGVTVIDDYGHHPVEIAVTLKAARTGSRGQVIAVVQPHRYSRLNDLFQDFCTCFNDADIVVVADVYAAGEAPIEGVDRDALVEGLRRSGHRNVIALPSPDLLARIVRDLARPGDMVVCLGAGSSTNWAAALPGELATLYGEPTAGGPA